MDADNEDTDMVIEDEAHEDVDMDANNEDRNIDQHESPQNLWSSSTESEAVDNSSCSQDLIADDPFVAGPSPQQAQILLATHQTEFNMDALPTRHGRPRRTRDMAEIYACICGNAVDLAERVMGSETAVCCGFEGCETSWFHLECLNFECAPRGWRCENHATRPRKRARVA